MSMQKPTHQSDAAALMAVIEIIAPLDEDARQRVHSAVSAYFNLSLAQAPSLDEAALVTNTGSEASDDLADFIAQANTKTEVDITLIAAYWLQFRQNNPNGFKTRVIKKELEAAGHKFSNLSQNLRLLAGKKKKYMYPSGGAGKEKTWKVSARGKKNAEEMLHGQD